MNADTNAASRATNLTELRWHDRIAALAIYCVIRCCNITWRFHLKDNDNTLKTIENGPVIYSLWHNRLALSMPVFRHFMMRNQPDRKVAALVSASRDGAILSRTLEIFGAQPVRGSTSRRGAQALLELTAWAERGHDIAISPDGPRGPRYQVQPGVISLAKVTGHPIIPISGFIRCRKELKSWDRFQIPLPFARCEIHIGRPLSESRKADDKEREDARINLEKRMCELTKD